MSKTKHNLTVIALVLSPLWIGLLASIGQPSDSLSGLGVIGGAILGIPIIAVIGLVISLLTRNSFSADRSSIIGYAVPAVLVCAYELFVILA